MAVPLAYKPIPMIAAPINVSNTFKKVNKGFFRQRPSLFMYNHSIPASPYVNQLAKREEMRESRSLKTGIDSAMIQAMNQTTVMMANQDPTARGVRRIMCLVPMLVNTVRFNLWKHTSEHSNVDQFGGDMGVNDTCYHDLLCCQYI
jgi:hypothetical protein